MLSACDGLVSSPRRTMLRWAKSRFAQVVFPALLLVVFVRNEPLLQSGEFEFDFEVEGETEAEIKFELESRNQRREQFCGKYRQELFAHVSTRTLRNDSYSFISTFGISFTERSKPFKLL